MDLSHPCTVLATKVSSNNPEDLVNRGQSESREVAVKYVLSTQEILGAVCDSQIEEAGEAAIEVSKEEVEKNEDHMSILTHLAVENPKLETSSLEKALVSH